MATFSIEDTSWGDGFAVDDNGRLRKREDIDDEQDFLAIVREMNRSTRRRWQDIAGIVVATGVLVGAALLLRGW